MKKFCLILCLLSCLALCAVGCETTARDDSYYRLFASHISPSHSVKTDLFGYDFEDFLERDYILVSETKEDKTLYGVVNGATNRLLFAPLYVDVEMIGDFFLLSPDEGGGDYRVTASDGTIIAEEQMKPTISDVGQGYVCVTTTSASTVYNSKGAEALPTSFLDENYVYTACGNFMMAMDSVKGDYQVFDLRTGESKLTLFPPTNTVLSVHYAGGNDFIVIYDTETSNEDNYDVVLQMGGGSLIYLKQTIRRLTVGMSMPRTVTFPGYVASVSSKTSFGKTERMREQYPVKDGYLTVGLYNVTGKDADGSIRYVLTDDSLNVVAELPDGIRPDTNTVDGYFLSGMQTANVQLFNDKLESILTLSEGPYHSALLSDGVIVVSKVNNGASLYAAYDTKGNLLIDYKYSYLSEFISGKSIGVRDKKSYLVGKDGSETLISDDPLPYWWDGYYERTENGRIGLTSYNGTVLTPASYESVEDVSRYGDTVYVALRIGNAVEVFKLY